MVVKSIGGLLVSIIFSYEAEIPYHSTPGYGSSSYGKASSRVSYMDHYGSQGSETFQSPPGFPNVVLIERDGRQIPLTNSGSTSSGGSHYSGSHGVSYSSGSGRY